MRRVAVGLVLGLPAALLLAGGAARAEEPLKISFAMPTSPSPYVLPFFIAQDLGWYEKSGLKVDEKVVVGDTTSLRALIAGDVDITDVGPNTIMQGFVNGAKIKLIGSFQPIADYRIVVRIGSGESLKEISDKRWAISSAGGMLQALPKMVMKKHGFDETKMQFLTVGGFTSRYQALVAGTVDASLLDTLLAQRGVREGKLKIVEALADEFPGLGYGFSPVRTDSLADPVKKKAIEIFMREGVKGARYIVDHPREAAEVMEKRLKEDNVEAMTTALQEMTRLGVWGVNGGLDRDVFAFTEKVYRETGEVTREVSYDELVDPSVVDAVLTEIGKR